MEINAIVFDFGDVFVNLKLSAAEEAFRNLGLSELNDELKSLNQQFEIGEIEEFEFLSGFQKFLPDASFDQIRNAWNAMIGDFPLHRLEFLQMLKGKFRLFLLTNTDRIHIAHFEQQVGESFARDFYGCFEKVHYSYELGLRKPDPAVFHKVLQSHQLSPKRTLFVDDREDNIAAAAQIGMRVWRLEVGKQDVTQLFEINPQFI